MIAVDEGRETGRVAEGLVRILSYTGWVSSNSPQVIRSLASLYPDAEASGSHPDPGPTPPLTVMEYTKDSGSRYRLYETNREVAVVDSAPDAVAHLEYLVNAAAMANLAPHLLIHAGVVASGNDGIVLPGPSGAGKSTLVAALCLSGFRYLSDEIAVLDGEPPAALPFLKAICLKDGGWETLSASFGTPDSLLDAMRADGERVHFLAAPHRLSQESNARVRFVLLPDRRAGASAALEPVSRATALAEMARHSLNLPRHGWSGVEALASIVEGAECYRLVYHDLREAVALISSLAGDGQNAGNDGTAVSGKSERVAFGFHLK